MSAPAGAAAAIAGGDEGAPPPASRWRRWRRAALRAGLAAAAFAALWHVSTREAEALYTVTAETERVSLSGALVYPIELAGARVVGETASFAGFRGTLEPADSVSVVMTRAAADTAVDLVLRPPPGGRRATATLRTPDGASHALDGEVMVRAPVAGGRVSIHFQAAGATVGAPWAPRSVSPYGRLAIRGGNVTVAGLSAGGRPFEARSFPLVPGEVLTGGDGTGAWWGVVFADDRPALQGTFASMGTRVLLRRGTESYPLSTTWFDRILADPALAFLCLVLALVGQVGLGLATNEAQRVWDDRRSPARGGPP